MDAAGSSYSAGTGIDITNNTISIDNTVALKSELFSGDYNDLTNKPDLSIYAQSANLATVATTGNYNDLTNKPTIPDAVSGTNDGTNWTSLTIGSDTYGLASGSAPSNMVTTDTSQNIGGIKTFFNSIIISNLDMFDPNGIYLSNLNNCYKKGLYAFDSNKYTTNREVGAFEFNYSNLITRNGKPGTFEYYTLLNNGYANEGQYETPSCVGFQINRRVNGTNTPKYFLAPRPAFGDSWNSAYDTYDAYYIPMVISDGTTNYYANEQGIVTIPAGGSSYTAGTGIDITNDAISVDSTVVALKSDIPTVPTNVSAFTNDAGYITAASVPTTATSTSTSTVTPSTIQLTFTFEDDTTQTVTLMTSATVSTTTTTTLS